MAISEHASGTRTAGTPPEAGFTALGTGGDATDGIFQFFIDVSNLAGGATPDSVEIQVLEKVLSSGTARLVYEAVLTGAQDELDLGVAVDDLHARLTLQIKQTAGTARTFDWSQRKIA
ncbi:MAG: hypothetical protein IPQ25_16985 [Chitinophagaceae bacterium]|nr:hypothetical protein [Chitinophagaceae bacterium]